MHYSKLTFCNFLLVSCLPFTLKIEEVCSAMFAGKEIQISFREGIEAYQPETEALLGS